MFVRFNSLLDHFKTGKPVENVLNSISCFKVQTQIKRETSTGNETNEKLNNNKKKVTRRERRASS